MGEEIIWVRIINPAQNQRTVLARSRVATLVRYNHGDRRTCAYEYLSIAAARPRAAASASMPR
jgi:hypothetical protein